MPCSIYDQAATISADVRERVLADIEALNRMARGEEGSVIRRCRWETSKTSYLWG